MSVQFEATAGLYPIDRTKGAFSYGTAGFRMRAESLVAIAARAAAVVALRSHRENKATGIMVTASHNPAPDNGLKLVDVDAGMLARELEPVVTELVNTGDVDLQKAYRRVAQAIGVAPEQALTNAVVYIGRDTRPSGEAIVKAAIATLHALGARVVDIGVVTTPVLHWCVWRLLQPNVPRAIGADTVVRHMSEAFVSLLPPGTSRRHLVVDCANGVGAQHVGNMAMSLEKMGAPIQFHLVHTDDDPALLNACCGADHCQKVKAATDAVRSKFKSVVEENPGESVSCYSVDGDADRVVSFAFPVDGPPGGVLLDGDRIIVLLAAFLGPLLSTASQRNTTQPDVRVVQTAYANGASTNYIVSGLQLPVFCTATGVKHLHPVAAAAQVGLYFEANGHGTVLFNDGHHGTPSFVQFLTEAARASGEYGAAARDLLATRSLLSQCCGDALADLLACEVALTRLRWTPEDWLALYADLPSVQIKVPCEAFASVTTTANEQRVTSHPELQDAVDGAVASACAQARAFVRPSGTEPIVRVYAEATTLDQATTIARVIQEAVVSLVK